MYWLLPSRVRGRGVKLKTNRRKAGGGVWVVNRKGGGSSGLLVHINLWCGDSNVTIQPLDGGMLSSGGSYVMSES